MSVEHDPKKKIFWRVMAVNASIVILGLLAILAGRNCGG